MGASRFCVWGEGGPRNAGCNRRRAQPIGMAMRRPDPTPLPDDPAPGGPTPPQGPLPNGPPWNRDFSKSLEKPSLESRVGSLAVYSA